MKRPGLSPDQRFEMQRRFQNLVATPMLVLAVVFVGLLLAPMLLDLSEPWQTALDALGWFIWAAFALELVVNTYLAERRLYYLRDHWLDVAIVALPLLRPLRVARVVRVLSLVAVSSRSATTLRRILATHGLQNILLLELIIVLTSAGVATHFERDSGGTIDGFPIAVWWALTTVTTVGYGDVFPVTAAGRGVGAFLMIFGIGMLGVITASVASFFIRSDRETVTAVTTDQLLAEIRRLEAKLDQALDSRDRA